MQMAASNRLEKIFHVNETFPVLAVLFLFCDFGAQILLAHPVPKPAPNPRLAVPIGAATSLDVAFGNISLLTISLSFYTMVKVCDCFPAIVVSCCTGRHHVCIYVARWGGGMHVEYRD